MITIHPSGIHMKKVGVLIIGLAIIVSSVIGGLALLPPPSKHVTNRDSMTFVIHFDKNPVIRDGTITIKDGMQLAYKHTELPYKKIQILLPYGTDLDSLNVETKKAPTLLKYSFSLKRVDITLTCALDKKSKEIKYINTGTYPNSQVSYSVDIFRGFRILKVYATPVKFINGKLYYYDSLALKISLKKAPVPSTYRGLKRDLIEVAMSVINPGEINTYPVKKIRGTEYRYIIITPQSLASAFQKLINHKKSRGLTATLITLEDIENTYSGKDVQEKIRNCIIDYYQNHGTEYVLLGGDTTDESGNPFLPHRATYANITASNGYSIIDIYSTEFPDDLYFSGLDGTWDSDGDGTYGEGDGGSIPEEADWLGEVAVGRAPVDTVDQVNTFINKVISFENNSRPNKVLLHAEDDSGNIGDLKVIKKNSGGHAAPGVEAYLPSYITVDEMFESDGATMTVAEYSNRINNNDYLFVNHCGHGDVNIYVIDGAQQEQFSKSDADSLTNTWYPIHASIACYAGSFDGQHPDTWAELFGGNVDGHSFESDRDCLAEEFIKNPNGGMVATMLNSRFGLAGDNDPTLLAGQIDNDLYNEIFNKGYINLGWAVQKARESVSPAYYDYSVGDYCGYKWQIYDSNLLGDPEMPVLNHHIIYGRVIDSSGNPADNTTTVTLKHVPSGQTFTTSTDNNGMFSFDLDALGLSYNNGDEIQITASNAQGNGQETINIDTSTNSQKVIVTLGIVPEFPNTVVLLPILLIATALIVKFRKS